MNFRSGEELVTRRLCPSRRREVSKTVPMSKMPVKCAVSKNDVGRERRVQSEIFAADFCPPQTPLVPWCVCQSRAMHEPDLPKSNSMR